MQKVAVVVALVLTAAGVACGARGDATSSRPSSRPSLIWETGTTDPIEDQSNDVPTSETTTSTSTTMPRSIPTVDPSTPVRISVEPSVVLGGGRIVVSYTVASDGGGIGGRWERDRSASWEQCTETACVPVAWLIWGRPPLPLPYSPGMDRAVDYLKQPPPDGPDDFEIPLDAGGAYRVCTTLRSIPEGVETKPCAPVTVAAVPVRNHQVGESPGWFEIDPASPPNPTSSELHVLVHPIFCERATQAGQPDVAYSDTEIAVLIPVVNVDCGARTPVDGPTPATVALSEPLGDRAVLDAICVEPLGISQCEGPHRGQRWPPL